MYYSPFYCTSTTSSYLFVNSFFISSDQLSIFVIISVKFSTHTSLESKVSIQRLNLIGASSPSSNFCNLTVNPANSVAESIWQPKSFFFLVKNSMSDFSLLNLSESLDLI